MLAPLASLSRDLQSAAVTPLLVHSLHETNSSVLSLAASEDYIFSGSQNKDILVNFNHEMQPTPLDFS
jgi:di- and tripeptidase